MDDKILSTITSDQQGNQYSPSPIPAHTHNNTDSLPISFKNLTNKVRYIEYRALAPTTAVTVATVGGDFVIPFGGYVTGCGATVDTAGTTGTMTVNIKKNGTSILLTDITIASGSKTSRTYTASLAPVLSAAQLTFNTGDIFTFVIDTIQTTPAQGLTVFMNVIETP